jgi:hypothetical protein
MQATTKQHDWSKLLNTFSEQNRTRLTRIAVFEGEPGNMNDYWLEDGMPLQGIDVDTGGKDAPVIEIMLGDAVGNADSSHFTHIVSAVRFARIILSASGESDGLDIEDAEGKTTILRFEN